MNEMNKCTHCNNDLPTKMVKGQLLVTIYLPICQGPTFFRPNGVYCSKNCYDNATEIKIKNTPIEFYPKVLKN